MLLFQLTTHISTSRLLLVIKTRWKNTRRPTSHDSTTKLFYRETLTFSQQHLYSQQDPSLSYRTFNTIAHETNHVSMRTLHQHSEAPSPASLRRRLTRTTTYRATCTNTYDVQSHQLKEKSKSRYAIPSTPKTVTHAKSLCVASPSSYVDCTNNSSICIALGITRIHLRRDNIITS